MSGQIDIETHILPLLEAIEWMGCASQKLEHLDGLAALSPENSKWMKATPNPDPVNASAFMGEVAWVAKDLLRHFQAQQGGEV